MGFAFLGVAALLAVVGAVLYRGKGAWLISGYNTMSRAEKARIDERRLCRFTGRFLFAMAGCWCLAALCAVWGLVMLWIGLGLFTCVVLGGLIYMNTGNRFQK